MGWKKTKIGEFLFERKGLLDPNDRALFSFKKIEKIDFSEGKIFLSDYSPTKTKQIIVKKGDFVFSGLNIEKGAVAINDFNQDLVVSANYSTCEVDYLKVDQNFLKFLIKSQFFKNLLKENLKKDYGFTRPKHLINLEIYLPPLEEQKQIAEKLKLNEVKQKRLQQEIDTQKTNLKNLRKQILQDAIEGKLTKEWREKNPDIEPASKLLEKIKIEKEKLIAKKKIKKEKPLPEINKNEIPFELPESWVWTRLGEMIFYAENLDIQKKLNSNTQIAYIDIDSIDNKIHKISSIKYKKVSELSSRARRVLKKGFLLYSTVRPYLENIAFVENDIENHIGSTGFNVFKAIKVDLNYIFYFLLSPNLNNRYKELMIGFNSPSITNSQFENTLIPIPPLSEQLAIVSKLQTIMQKIDEAEQQIEKSLEYSKQLYSAILSEAFNFSK